MFRFPVGLLIYAKFCSRILRKYYAGRWSFSPVQLIVLLNE